MVSSALAGMAFGGCANPNLEWLASGSMSTVAVKQSDSTRQFVQASSRIGLRQAEFVDIAWRRSLRGDLRLQSVPPNCPSEVCLTGPAIDAEFSASLDHYAYGRFSLGREASLASEVVRKLTPFGFETIGSDRCAALLALKCERLRPLSATYDGPTFGALTPSMQVSRGGNGVNVMGAASIELMGGQATFGLSGGESGRWLAPVGVSLPFGRFRAFGLLTFGRAEEGKGRYSAIGATTPLLGGELRTQWSTTRLANSDRRSKKAAVGWHRPLSADWVLSLDAAAAWSADGRRIASADLGLRWTWP